MKLGIVTIIGALILAGCGMYKDPNAELVEPNVLTSAVDSISAFNLSVYAIEENKCASCHGAGIGPQFVVDDIAEAYAFAKGYTNFQDVPSSRLVQRMKDGHCGMVCQTDGTEMEAAIRFWWENGESAVNTGASPTIGIQTVQLTIPAVLPTGNTFTTLTFNLTNLDPLLLANVQFSIEIQSFGTDAYRVRRPRLITMGLPITVRDIKVVLNGEYDPLNNAYTNVNTTVPATTSQILDNTSVMLILKEGGAGVDKISIGFQHISP